MLEHALSDERTAQHTLDNGTSAIFRSQLMLWGLEQVTYTVQLLAEIPRIRRTVILRWLLLSFQS